MRKLYLFIAIIVCLVLVVPVVGGCSKTEDENTFMKLLSMLPSTAKDGGGIAIIDYQRLWQENGISFYTSDNEKMSDRPMGNVMKQIKNEEYLITDPTDLNEGSSNEYSPITSPARQLRPANRYVYSFSSALPAP